MPVTVIPFFSSLASPKLIESYVNHLRKSGATIQSSDETKRESSGLCLFFIGSGGTEKLVADYIHEMEFSSPIILLSHSANNSLAASMELRAYFENKGLSATIVYHSFQELVEKLSKWVEFDKLLEKISTSTLGLVGSPSFWLIASDVDSGLVRDKWGLKIKNYDLGLLKDSPSSSTIIPEDFKHGASNICVDEDEVRKAMSVAARLDEVVTSEDLDAVTVQCFDFLTDTSVSGCIALSHVNNRPNRVAGCEGDIPTTFSMLLGKILTGNSSFMANVTEIDVARNTAVFAHCTVPTSLVNDYELTTHYESDMSVGIRGVFKKQRVTIFKVFGEALQDYWVSSGTIIENLRNENGCRTQIRVELTEDVSYFLEQSLGNHHIIIPGDHACTIQDFFSFVHLRE